MQKPRRPPSEKLSQTDRFIETARALNCDEDLAAFDEKLAVVARAKPKDEGQKSGTSRPKKSET